MKDKIKHIVPILVLFLFSIYYTNKSIDLIRNTDPIMKKIKETTPKYQKKASNAKVVDNTIIPGINGLEINLDKSYKNMKQYGSYNETLTVLEEVKPTISIDDTYDKYVISGNEEIKNVSLVFKASNNDNITDILNILKLNNVEATVFVDGLWLENNLNQIIDYPNVELEILSYDSKYQEVYFTSSINYLNNITKRKAKYCYADYDNKEIINLCQKLKLHTIIPTIKVGNYPYKEIKQKVSNGSIIYMPTNTSTKIELKSVIDYLKNKGYKLSTIDTLLNESLEK